MVKKRFFKIPNRTLAIFLLLGLFIQFVLPNVGLGIFSFISTFIYLGVSIYLFIF